MSENRCKDCQNYIQHYAFAQGKPFRVNCGHCVISKPNRKRPEAKACENFVTGPRESDFATRAYLRKTLLQYILSLEIFPETDGNP